MSVIIKIGGARTSSYSAEVQQQPTNPPQDNNVEHQDVSPPPEEVQGVGVPISSGCFGLPYMDHNYGAPPPPSTPPALPPPPARVNGQVVQDPASVPLPAKEETVDDSVTRCICEFQHDDGYMICCDKCSVWQHIDCMGIERGNIPESYYCEQCHPRSVDVDRARMIQSKKREEMDTSATDTDPEEAANHLASLHKKAAAAAAAKGKAVKQKKTLNKNKERPPPRQKKREKKIKKEKENIKEVLRKQKGSINGQVKEVVAPKLPKSKSRRKVGLEVDSTKSYNSHESPVTESFTRISMNSCSDEVVIMAAAMKLQGVPDNDELPFNKLSRPLVKVFDVRRGRKGLVANEDIISGTPIIEYIGYITLKHCFGGKTEEQKTYKPFVLLYSELEGLNLIVDASTMGNDARYVRRSCTPNAQVQHYFVRGNIHLVISAKQLIQKRSEITIPFDFDFKECPFPVECACLGSDCQVSKFWGKTKNSRSRNLAEKPQRTRRQSVTPAERKTQHRRNSNLPSAKRASVELPAAEPEPVAEVKLENMKQESEAVPAVEPEPPRPRSSRRASSSSVAVETPLPMKIEETWMPGKPPEAEEKKLEATKHESGPDYSSETDESSRKMTREERKMEAIVKAIEKMEKREVRRKEALARINKHAKEETKQTGEEVSEVPEGSPAVATSRPEANPESPHKVSKGKKSKRISRKRSRVHSVSAAASESEPPSKRSRVKSLSVVSEHALSQDESSSASTSIPSAPSTPVPSNPSPQGSSLTPSSSHPSSVNTAGEFLKVPRKKKLMMERQQDTKPGVAKTEPLEVAVEEAMFVTCLPSPSNALERLQRRYSHSAGSHKPGDSGVAAKKRWLRQAMSNEGGSSSPLMVASSPSLVTQPHSPGSSPPHDFVTPLKKRRLARESLSQDQPSASCPSTPSPSQLGQGGPDFPGSPSEPGMLAQDPYPESRLIQLAQVALEQEEAPWPGMERVQVPGEPGRSTARSSQARVLVEGEREDRSETATFMPASQEVASTETTLIANYVDAELGRRASHEKMEETNERRSAEANVDSSGQTGHPSTAESDATSESRPKTPAEQSRDCSEEVSSLREPKPPDRVGCSSSVTDSSLSACTETSGVSESESVVGVKDKASIMELKNLDSLESSSSSAQCRVNEEETETLRTDVLVDSPETCESGEERTWGHISSSQGFVPAGNWEDLQPASQQSTSSTGGPVEVDCSEREVSHGQSISSSGDVAEESRVCSSNSEAALEPVDSVEESGLCRPRSLREASRTGEETLASGGSLEVPREAASSATEESVAAPQECRVSSCSQDLSGEGEAGISSSHGRRSPGREAEGGECDSSVPGMGEVSRVEAPSRVRVPAWGEECGVDSTTQLWDRPSADPTLSPEVPSGVCRTPGRDAMRTPGEAQSAPPAQTSRVEARPGLEPDASCSSQTDSTSAQPSAKRKVSLLEYRKRRKVLGKCGLCPKVSASEMAAPFASPPNQELSLAEAPPTLKPLPLFNTSPPPQKPGPPNKAGGAGPGKRKEKQMSLSERLRLEFGLDDSVEEDKGQGDEDPDSGPNQQRMIPPPPPSTPYPGHLAGSCLPPAAPAMNSHMLSLRAPTGGLPLRPSSPSPSSPLLPTPPPPPPPLHPSSSTASPLLPFPGTSSVPSHINGGSGLPLGKPGPSKGPPSPFPRPPAPPYCPPMPPGFINTVPPPPPGLPTPLNRIPVAAPVGQADSMALQRPGMGNGFVPNKRP